MPDGLPPLKERRFRRWPAAAVAVALVALLLGGVHSLTSLSTANQLVQHTDEVRVALDRILATCLDAETGMRAYLVAGDPALLEPYDRAVRSWRAEMDRVRALTADNPAQQERLDRLQAVVVRFLDSLAQKRAAFDRGARGVALLPMMREGKRQMDEARSIIAEMLREEERLDDLRRRDALRRWRLALLLFVGGALASVLVASAVWFQRSDAEARRVRAEEAARANELFGVVLQGAALGITVRDPTGKLVYANDAAARLFGYASTQELLAAPPTETFARVELFDREGNPLPPERLPGRAALEGVASEEVTIRLRARGAHDERWSTARSVPARDPAGRVIYAIHFLRDVTDERREREQDAFLLRAPDELNSSLDYEKTLAAVARLAVPVLADWCAIDLAEGERTRRVAIAHVDPSKIALVEELERRYPPDPDAPRGVYQILRSGKPELLPEIPRELLVATAVDEEHLALIDRLALRSYIGAPLVVRGKRIGVVNLAMAESGRRYTERDLHLAQALADRAALAIENARLFREVERARDREAQRRAVLEHEAEFARMFIGILGHDLRNPLNAVSMAATLLQRKGGVDPAPIERIQSSARRMSAMVRQLLDLTRSRLAGGIAIERAPADLSAIVSGAVEELRLGHPGTPIEWRSPGPVEGAWDRDRLAQMVSNLVGNALDHGDPARPVTVALTPRADEVELRVHNFGPPIPADLLQVIFEPYRRNVANTPRAKGLGLGLFITQQIVAAHDGRIEVASTAEAGTTFTVTLPRRPKSLHPEARPVP